MGSTLPWEFSSITPKCHKILRKHVFYFNSIISLKVILRTLSITIVIRCRNSNLCFQCVTSFFWDEKVKKLELFSR